MQRESRTQKIALDELVQDDIVILTSGCQICADSTVITGVLEVNEAMLTGESEPVVKATGDMLYSGSHVISGKCYAKVEHVGAQNYSAQIANEVKKARQLNSELMLSMRRVTGITGFLILPLGIVLLVQALFLRATP